ncbi:amidase family protein [Anaerocolumna sp. MB42-C2]|uniref:amidase family protein n=1 Tax=Anaerocolumna sp. MB42-C2 TaxID=3070997 RepID=UPI0027DF4257|nr:amidase family protein [Anaerocolumna sp. MB42-C2]WMJ89318.1 amidase family protein [Anaerocolumna sp. MB42-C2]
MKDLNEITILELVIMLRNKNISAKELVQHYIKRIQLLDQGENGLNSVIEINQEAIEIADQLDKKGFKGAGMLAGIPILIKDNIDTADFMHTSAGSLALADSIAASDADLVKGLRESKAIILGKTNMTEFANYMTQDMPSGYSSRGGQVKSPYKVTENPSGSSSGSAVATAANLCVASIGTDTCNSIIAPGLKNGIVGFRPSIGTISRKGIIPISNTLDTAGPMTRTVTDASILFSELTNTQIKINNIINLDGVTVGINEWGKEVMTEEETVKTDEIIKELAAAGGDIKRIEIPATKNVMPLMKYEFKNAINHYLSELPAGYPIRSLKDIIHFNMEHKDLTLRYGQSYLIEAEENTWGNQNQAEYQEILADRTEELKKIRYQLRNIDVCIMLITNNILHYTGLPSITVPCGLYKNGMPYGIILTAKTDFELLKYANAVEMIVGQRVKPL